MGPFNDDPFNKLHVSPVMTPPEPDGSHRLIVNHSWPQGLSVNSRIPQDMCDDFQFMLRYPTIDLIVDQITQTGPHAVLYKVDLQCAYRNLRSDSCDFHFLGLQ